MRWKNLSRTSRKHYVHESYDSQVQEPDYSEIIQNEPASDFCIESSLLKGIQELQESQWSSLDEKELNESKDLLQIVDLFCFS